MEIRPKPIKWNAVSSRQRFASILLYGCSTWTLTKTTGEEARRQLRKEYCEQSWTSSGGNTLQDTQCTATCLLSRKLFKLDEPDMPGHCWRSRDELISDVLLWTPHTWPCKSRTTSTNIHPATMWGYGMLSRRPAWGDER